MKLDENALAAQREFLRFWTQGIIANYSSANVNGMHEIIEVTERDAFTDITMRSRFGYNVAAPNGKRYKTQTCSIHVTVTCDSIEIEE